MKARYGVRRGLGLAAVLVLAGCPTSPSGGGVGRQTRPPSEADLEGIELVSLEIRPGGPAATKYGGPVEHSLTEVEQAVVAAMADLPITHAPALSHMVRELAVTTPDRINVPPALIDGLMAWSGLVDPPPRLVVVELPEDPEGCYLHVAPGCRDALASLVDQVTTTLPDAQPIDFGVGVVSLPGGRTRMMVAVLERAVQLDPLPVAVSRKGSFSVAGRLLGGRTKPRVEVIGPGGRNTTLGASLSVDGHFGVRVGCDDGSGAYQLEVMADGRYGPDVVANFPVYCGATPPVTIAMVVEKLDPGVGADQIARANFLYLNEERRARGLSPLEWDGEAASIALAHSVDMHTHGFVGHTSPTTGNVDARFGQAGVQSTILRENVARGYGPKGIHDHLMNSPGHRVNILAIDVTHVGVGVVVGEPETDLSDAARPMFATQVFYRKLGAGAPAKDPGPALQGRIDEARKTRGLAPVRWSDELSAIAQKQADAHGRGRPGPKDWEDQVYALGYVSVALHSFSSIDYDALAGAELWNTPVLEAGVGVARTKEPGGGEGFLAIVLVPERE